MLGMCPLLTDDGNWCLEPGREAVIRDQNVDGGKQTHVL